MAEDAPVDRVEPAFAGETAWYYARYRRDYPTQLVERLRPFAHEGEGRLLDLGCGTGQLLLQLAPYFKHSIGIDPEPDMLYEAAHLAHERGIDNAEWIEASTTDLPNLATELGVVDLVTIATAFHFMEPQTTLRTLTRLVRGGGAVAVAYNGSPMWLHPDAWAKALRRALETQLGSVSELDVAVEGLRACELAMQKLGYTDIEHWQHTYESVIDIDFIVGHIYTALSPGRIPTRERPSFEERIKHEITAVAHSDHVSETVAVRVLIGRPPDH